MDNILEIKDLKVRFDTAYGEVKAVDGVSFGMKKGERLCLVGESGCGKTTAALSILRLLDSPPGRIAGGEIMYNGLDLLTCSMDKLRQIRGNRIAMIFQDPQTSLNPVFTVGEQIAEPIRFHQHLGRHEALEKAISLMEQVGIPRAQERAKDYPHQFSGGMKQRVMIAAALSCDPEILIADEPTTALDTTVKAQMLDIFREMKKQRDMSLLFITHDLGTVAGIADRILVMYGGKVAEAAPMLDLFDHPMHPYTRGLLACLPSLTAKKERLTQIPGAIPDLVNPPTGCIFHPRCAWRLPVCDKEIPGETVISGGHTVSCHLYPQGGSKA